MEMFNRKNTRAVFRGITALLVVAMLAGCATQKVDFTSIPPGATVTIGERQGITPCTFRVAKEDGPAVFRLASGEEMVLPLHGLDSYSKESVDASGKVFGASLMGIGGAVAIVGGVVFFAVAILDPDDEEDANDEILGYSLATMLCGGAVFAFGKWIYPDYDEAIIHADFRRLEDPGEKGELEDALFEDPGYGARRLKKAAP
jgi:hypothetical protein